MVATKKQTAQADDAKIYPETEYSGEDEHEVYKRLWPDGDEEVLPLEPSLKLGDHSKDFGWGYEGSSSAQLALALLLDATSNPDTALNYYQEFKQAIVAGWGKEWLIFRSDIIHWLRQRENIKIGRN